MGIPDFVGSELGSQQYFYFPYSHLNCLDCLNYVKIWPGNAIRMIIRKHLWWETGQYRWFWQLQLSLYKFFKAVVQIFSIALIFLDDCALFQCYPVDWPNKLILFRLSWKLLCHCYVIVVFLFRCYCCYLLLWLLLCMFCFLPGIRVC